jgi:prevent-host-death family protein
MMTINIHEAKTHLSRLLVRVELGEEIILARAGKPVARLAPLARKSGKRRLGCAAGEFEVPDDFNAPLPPEIEETFWR